MLVRYENLCHDPATELKRICSFLGIAFNAVMLSFRADSGHIVMANRMRFDSIERIIEDLSWMSDLSENEMNMIYNNQELVLCYNEFGYKLQPNIYI